MIPTAIPRRSAGTSPATSRLVAGFASACPTPARATATTNQRYDWAREAIDIAPTITVARARSPRRSPTTSTTCPVTSDIPAATPNMTETSSPSAARDSSHCSVRNGANTLTEYSPSGGIAIPAVATPVETCHRLATPPPLPRAPSHGTAAASAFQASRAGTSSGPTADHPREDLVTRVGGDRA